jgi:hypothetical protein
MPALKHNDRDMRESYEGQGEIPTGAIEPLDEHKAEQSVEGLEGERFTTEGAIAEFDAATPGLDYEHLIGTALPTAEHQIELAIRAERAQDPGYEGMSLRDLQESMRGIETELREHERVHSNQRGLIEQHRDNPDITTARASLDVWANIVHAKLTLERLRKAIQERPERT